MLEKLKGRLAPVYFLREPLLRYPILVGLLLALYAPNSVLDDYPFLKPFTQFMGTILPPIQYYAEKSKFHQVTELYFALMWLFAPLHFYFLNQDFHEQRFEWARKWKLKELTPPYRGFKQYAHRVFIVLILMPALIIFYLFYNKGYDFNLLPINSSRVMLGLFGFWFAGAAAFAMLQYEHQQLKKLLLEIRLKFSRGV